MLLRRLFRHDEVPNIDRSFSTLYLIILLKIGTNTMAFEMSPAHASSDQDILYHYLREIHSSMVKIDTEDSRVFLQPVDPRIAPDYHLIIKKPMDLSIISTKIDSREYATAWDYIDDMWLIFDNAVTFNRPGSFHNKYAHKFIKTWSPKMTEIMEVGLASHNYCCGKRRQLTAVAYRCRAATCFVKYGCTYWFYDPKDGDDEVIFCQAHYQKLPPEVVLPRYSNGTGPDIKINKLKFSRAKHNTPLIPERLVSCKDCHIRHHEICVMHNSLEGREYQCRVCKTRQNIPDVPARTPMDLPTCALSQLLEDEVALRFQGQTILVRVVNFSREKSERKERFLAKYPDHPKEFPYIRKEILCFIMLEGWPVCFFGMIVHEYGADSAEPNSRRVYLSLLDSVKLPKTCLASPVRTGIYHSVVRGYLRYTGARGFLHAHIYTCPPRKGQNYIFPFKPEDQKEISVTRLRKWYSDLLIAASTSSPLHSAAIAGFKNIGDAFPKMVPLQIPYFEGDNWPDILEDVLKLDAKQESDDVKKTEIRLMVENIQISTWAENTAPPLSKKPRITGVYYDGLSPPPRPKKKARKLEPKVPLARPKLTLLERINLVVVSSKKDFLVVKLLSDPGDPFILDPDANLSLASTGPNYTVASFLRGEKLEFSTMRHSRFATMMLLYLLSSPDKVFVERYPDTVESSL